MTITFYNQVTTSELNKGYTKDNIQLVTWAVNQSKNNLTNEQFLDLVSKIYNNNQLK